MIRVFYILFIVSIFINANFIDSDLDGVEDSYDLCPNSKITDIVDKNGCSVEELKFNDTHLDIYLGYSYFDDSSSSLNISIEYKYNEFGLYLFSKNLIENLDDDYTLGFSYTQVFENLKVGFDIGFYIPTSSSYALGYFTQTNLTLFLNDFDISAYFRYNFLKNKDRLNAKSFGFSLGYNINEKLYASIGYSYSDKIYLDSTNSKYVNLYINYFFDTNYYITAEFAKNLDNTNDRYSIGFGYFF